jgi:acyl-CoA synthetase (AMP-forming)/AMP-acid ligase II
VAHPRIGQRIAVEWRTRAAGQERHWRRARRIERDIHGAQACRLGDAEARILAQPREVARRHLVDDVDIAVVEYSIEIDPADVIAWTRERIAAFKAPKSVDVIPVMPRNASGKILRRELRAPYWEGQERQIS